MADKQKDAELTADQKIELLANKVIFALQYANFPGAGLVAHGVHGQGPVSMVHWTEDFRDALGRCGFPIDREALDKVRNPPRSRRGQHVSQVLSGQRTSRRVVEAARMAGVVSIEDRP